MSNSIATSFACIFRERANQKNSNEIWINDAIHDYFLKASSRIGFSVAFGITKFAGGTKQSGGVNDAVF